MDLRPPYKITGLVALLVLALVIALAYFQFRGGFTPKTKLTLLASRAGLVTDPGARSYNGVQIGWVASLSEVEHDGKPVSQAGARCGSQVHQADSEQWGGRIKATTVLCTNYVSLTSPKNPTPQRITAAHVIDATSVTTEFNTLFQTISSIAEKVDPVKVNLTLSATAQALNGLGDKSGQSLVNGMTSIRR